MNFHEGTIDGAPLCTCQSDVRDVLGAALERNEAIACPVHSATNSPKAVPLGDHLAHRIAAQLGASIDGDLPPAA